MLKEKSVQEAKSLSLGSQSIGWAIVKSSGFKQTEIGLLPEDWEIESIGNLTSKIIGGGTPSRIVKEYWNGKIPWMTVKDFTSFNPNFTQENITELGLKNSATRIVPAGNLIIATRIALGKIVKYNVDVTINQDLKTINLFPKINKDYFIYSYRNIEEKIIEKGSGSTVLGLSVADLNSFQIPLPSLPEQEAIAEALSDADAWIESLEQLIAKKRLIKQGAMQELLSPKEDWEEYDFKNVVWFQEGPGLRNWQFTKDGIKVINVTNLENGYLNLAKTSRHISINEFEKMYKHFEIDEDDIVVASSGNSYGKVSVVRKQDLPLVMNTSVIRFKPSAKIGYKYLLIFLKSYLFKDQIDLLITGGAQPNFGPAHLNKIKILSPKDISEQTRIATILSDMDAELEALEAQLDKARKVKQGMMQELLTGRVRLL